MFSRHIIPHDTMSLLLYYSCIASYLYSYGIIAVQQYFCS